MRARTIQQGLMLAPWRLLASRWPWLALLHVLLTALVFVVSLPIVVVTLIALPLWSILVAALERRRIRMLGAPVRASGHVRVPKEQRHNWLNIRLTEPATWRETVALLVDWVLGILALALLLAQAIGVGLPVALAVVGVQRIPGEVTLFLDMRYTPGPSNWWIPLLLLPVSLVLFGYLNAALAAAHASLIGWLLAPRHAEISGRVDRLTRSRAAVVAAHESERRRIERDLHDGVQQELVGIAARLGMLELELASNDERAAWAALRAAQDQTERALETLRDTVRGIQPAVLADHGLPSAVDELSGRSALPLRVHDAGFPRLEAAAEAAGYFLVAEAVTNAAKHTAATRVDVELTVEGASAVVIARDNGHGGADPEAGSGLAGIAGRAEALGGLLRVISPVGGPTTLRMELPLAAAEGDRDADPARG